MSIFSLIPWKPAIITIFFLSNSSLILDVSIVLISASWLVLFVYIPACHPVNEIAGYPILLSKMLNFAVDICSPALNSASISLISTFGANSFACDIRLSVVFPWADKTTTILFSLLYKSIILLATVFNFSLSATELPPNFITIVSILTTSLKFNWNKACSQFVHFSIK